MFSGALKVGVQTMDKYLTPSTISTQLENGK